MFGYDSSLAVGAEYPLKMWIQMWFRGYEGSYKGQAWTYRLRENTYHLITFRK